MPQPPFQYDDPDAAFADDPLRPDVKKHQQDHKVIADMLNRFDYEDLLAAGTDGHVITYDSGGGLYRPEVLPASIPGADGDSAYDVAVDNGFVGTEEEWLDSLIGIYWQGDWSSATTYVPRDVVKFGRHTYIALTTHANSAPTVDSSGNPTSSTNWDPFAAGGEDGAPGSDGLSITGPPGEPGPSREGYEDLGSVSGSVTIDAGDATMYKLTLVDDATIQFLDSSGAPASAITLRIFQGSGAPWTVTWDNVSHWNTDDGLEPDLGSSEGDVKVVVVDQMEGDWYGYSPGVAAAPPAETFPTLDWEEISGAGGASSSNTTADPAVYPIGSAFQVGSKRGGMCAVVAARDDSVDPAIPTLTGGGATWVQGATTIFGTGSTRRRLTLFYARDVSPGAAAQMSASHAGGGSYSGCIIYPIRTTGNVPDTFVATATGNDSQRQQGDAGEVSSSATLANAPLSSPGDAANRVVMALAHNGTGVTITPEQNVGGNAAHDWEVLGTPKTGTSPTLFLGWYVLRPVFDTTPSAGLSPGATWALAAAEQVQG